MSHIEVTILTSHTGLHHHLRNWPIDEDKYESRDDLPDEPPSETFEDVEADIGSFIEMIMETEGFLCRDIARIATARWNQYWGTNASNSYSLKGNWTDALEDAIEDYSLLALKPDRIFWRTSLHKRWEQDQRLRPALEAAGIDLTARLKLRDLNSSGCLRAGELPGLVSSDWYDPTMDEHGWYDFRLSPDDPDQVLFTVKMKNFC